MEDKQLQEIEKLQAATDKIFKMSDEQFMKHLDTVSDCQPFMMSLSHGWFNEYGEDAVMDIHCLLGIVFLYLGGKDSLSAKALTAEVFMKFDKANVDLAAQLEKLPNQQEFQQELTTLIDNHQHRSLLGGVLMLINSLESFREWPYQERGIFFTGIKSLIEGLEEVSM